jgi:hypothetical protein
MVIGRVLSHIARELCDLDLALELSLETGKEDLSLPRLQPITEAWDRAGAVSDTELNELFVHKVPISEELVLMVHIVVHRVGCEPVLPLIRQLLIKCKFNHIIVLLIHILELDLMLIDI